MEDAHCPDYCNDSQSCFQQSKAVNKLSKLQATKHTQPSSRPLSALKAVMFPTVGRITRIYPMIVLNSNRSIFLTTFLLHLFISMRLLLGFKRPHMLLRHVVKRLAGNFLAESVPERMRGLRRYTNTSVRRMLRMTSYNNKGIVVYRGMPIRQRPSTDDTSATGNMKAKTPMAMKPVRSSRRPVTHNQSRNLFTNGARSA